MQNTPTPMEQVEGTKVQNDSSCIPSRISSKVPSHTHFLMLIPYQKKYDRAVIQELVEWFRARFDRLPQRLQLRPGVVIPDVKVMVRNYLDIVQMHHENPTYGAQVHHLFEVRDCLLAEGFE